MIYEGIPSELLLGSLSQLQKELQELPQLKLPGCTAHWEGESLRHKISLIEKALAQRISLPRT